MYGACSSALPFFLVISGVSVRMFVFLFFLCLFSFFVVSWKVEVEVRWPKGPHHLT